MKKKHLGQRILLSLLLSGCVSSYASAADGTYTYEYNTYTVSDGTGTVTYTDANGTEHTYTYSTKTAVSGKDSYDITTTYTSDVAAGGGENTAYIDGVSTLPSIVLNTADGEKTVNITVKYGENSESIDNSDNHIAGGDITGDFIDDNRGSNAGGAIFNYAYATDATIGTITGNFIGNSETSSSYENGGSIFNYSDDGNTATIGKIKGNFIGNYLSSSESITYGGNITNQVGGSNATATIGAIEGDFIGNYAYSDNTSSGLIASGGAIQNFVFTNVTNSNMIIGNITGNFIGNYIETTGAAASANGGAIFNGIQSSGAGNTAQIGIITGNFTGNYAFSKYDACGGAIFNEGWYENTATIKGIEGNFIGNYVYNDTTYARAGAIMNDAEHGGNASIDYINGSFINNYAQSIGSGYAQAGAIRNIATDYSTSTANIGQITGSFIGNYALTTGTYAYAGAIYNWVHTNGNATIDDIAGDFIANYAKADAGSNDVAVGGAIYNYFQASEGTARIGSENGNGITGSFIQNYADSYSSTASGGAIANDGADAQVVGVNGGFYGNYATGATGAYGGAIYNVNGAEIGDITGTEDGSGFVGNYAKATSGAAYGGAIYNDASEIDDITGDFVANTATGSTNAYGGAIYNDDGGVIGAITQAENGGFIANSATAESSDTSGGAIYNNGASEIGKITADFAYNSVSGSAGSGGAIYNADGAAIGQITGTFEGNYAQGDTAAAGGAIYNTSGTIGEITGDFSSNYVTTTAGDALGGAIYTDNDLSINGALAGNSAASEQGNAQGGAIYSTGTLMLTSDDGIGENYAIGADTAQGGAIYNAGSGSQITVGDVMLNYVEAGTGAAQGGAIYNPGTESTITITGDVAGNYATSTSGAAQGGALYNESDTVTVTGSLTGNAVTAGTDAMGGAIYNANGTLSIIGDVAANTAKSTSGDAYGGAIYNAVSSETSEIATASTASTSSASATTTVTGDLLANSVTAAGDAYGGAIYNDSGEVTINGNIAENTATSTSGEALGGAIYNAGTGTVNINSDNKELFITGNSTSSDSANALYAEADTTTNLNLTNSGDIFFYDNFNGETGYTVNVTGESVDNNTLYLYNDMYNANLNIGGVTIDTINNDIHTYSVNKFTLTGNTQMVADVDLKNEQMDRFSTGYLEKGTENYGSNNGTLTVSGMNLISDTTADSVAIYYAEPGLKEYVASTVGELPDGNQTDVYAPVYKYNVEYKKDYELKEDYAAEYAAAVEAGTAEGMASELDIDNGGYFVFNKTGENPAIKLGQVAQMGAFTGMALMYEYSFEHSDYYMKLPSEVRLAIREKAKAAKALKEAKKNGTTVEEETANIEAADAAEKASHEGVKFYERDDTFHLYKEHELTTDGIWVHPFASHESVPFAGQFTVKNNNYGALIGIDTEFKEQDNGWASVFTGYIGYNGSTQGYAGNHVRQDGGVIGVTESFYKKNYYAAITLGGGAGSIDGDTMYGSERTHEYAYGVALKTGWSLEYDGGKYTFLPTFMASWTNVNLNDYTNAAGVKMDVDPFRAVQLKPNFKLIRNYKNGWQPYLTVGEVWTVGQTSGVKAGEFNLEKLSFRPYTEYGIGVQKRWTNNYDGYAQVLGHAGGRRGVLVNIGFRWVFN